MTHSALLDALVTQYTLFAQLHALVTLYLFRAADRIRLKSASPDRWDAKTQLGGRDPLALAKDLSGRPPSAVLDGFLYVAGSSSSG